jgi:hypothetical protein
MVLEHLDMKNKYQWQGEPVTVRFGYVNQQENLEKPMYWYNFECCTKEEIDGSFRDEHMVKANGKHFALIPAVEVESQSGYKFLLANHFGIAVSKLIKGGWPNHAHFSLDGEFSENKAPYYAFKKFDLAGYENHENERRKWQKKTFPQEFERMEQFRASMRNFSKTLTP